MASAPRSRPSCSPAGARVLICRRDAQALTRTVDELSAIGEVKGIPADLATRSGIDALVEQVTSRTGGMLHLLVNAGTTRDGDWQAYPRPEWDATPRRAHHRKRADPLLVVRNLREAADL